MRWSGAAFVLTSHDDQENAKGEIDDKGEPVRPQRGIVARGIVIALAVVVVVADDAGALSALEGHLGNLEEVTAVSAPQPGQEQADVPRQEAEESQEAQDGEDIEPDDEMADGDDDVGQAQGCQEEAEERSQAEFEMVSAAVVVVAVPLAEGSRDEGLVDHVWVEAAGFWSGGHGRLRLCGKGGAVGNWRYSQDGENERNRREEEQSGDNKCCLSIPE